MLIFSIIFPAFASLVFFGSIDEGSATFVLNNLFFLTGIILFLSLLAHLIKTIYSKKYEYLRSDDLAIALFIGSISLFIILFAPFIATRHILYVIPLLLLFGRLLFLKSSTFITTFTLVVSIALGLLLGISDWLYADYYRKSARYIKIDTDHTVWSVGHWGWQWYTGNEGMKIYDINNESLVGEGDYIVYPADISSQHISGNIKLRVIDKVWTRPSFFTFFSGHHFASLYNSFIDKPSWTLSNTPIDTIMICHVERVTNTEEVIRTIKSDENWFNSVLIKSKEQNIPTDSMIALDAAWVMEKNRMKR